MKKQPYGIGKSKALHQHWTWKGGSMHAKVQFKTLDEAIEFMRKRKLLNRYHAYVCQDCGMWHIGHNRK